MLAVSYLANSVLTCRDFSGWNLVYWAAFLAACLLLVRFCLDMTWLQGVYCAVFACAMQHVAFDVNEIYNLLGGEHILVQLLIYAGIYGLFYHLFAKKIPQQGRNQLSMESMFPMVTIFLIVWILSVLGNLRPRKLSGACGKPDLLPHHRRAVLFLCPVGAGEPKRKKPF